MLCWAVLLKLHVQSRYYILDNQSSQCGALLTHSCSSAPRSICFKPFSLEALNPIKILQSLSARGNKSPGRDRVLPQRVSLSDISRPRQCGQ